MSSPTGHRHDRLHFTLAIALIVALVVFAALADELAEWQPFVSLDRHVDEELNEAATPWVTTAMEAVSWLGGTIGLAVVTAAASGALLIRRHVRAAVFVALAFIGAELLDALLKVEFARPRPSVADPVSARPGGYSFPSGHATASMAVYGALAYLAIATVRRPRARITLAAGALLLVILIGFSRVYLGAHFPSDVIGGWCVGLGWVALLALLLWGVLPVLVPRRTALLSARRSRSGRGA